MAPKQFRHVIGTRLLILPVKQFVIGRLSEKNSMHRASGSLKKKKEERGNITCPVQSVNMQRKNL